MPRYRRLLTAALAATASLALALPVGPARADQDPIFIGWSSLLPPLSRVYTPSTAAQCAAGESSCVDATIAAMTDRFTPQATSCGHKSVFSLAYLRTTQEYQRAAAEPGFFADTPYVNHEDAVFAAYYFEAYDNWIGGNRDAVPPAWRTAFDAADGKKVSATGDLLLGMNAHVNRDLPMVLASLGIVRPDGTSRKADHDKVNVFLNRVSQPLIAEIAARFDPQVDDTNTPYGLTYTTLMQILVTWREAAWRNAELLVAAPTPAARALVVNTIETTAAAQATALRLTQSYVPPLSTTGPRDAFCTTHHG